MDKCLEEHNLPRLSQEEIENINRPITIAEIESLIKNLPTWSFPGGAAVESLPANAGDTGSSPGLGGSHMPRSNWAREPQLLSLRVWSLCSATRGCDSERPMHCNEEWPPLATTREGPRTETRTQHSHELKKKKKSSNKQRPRTRWLHRRILSKI